MVMARDCMLVDAKARKRPRVSAKNQRGRGPGAEATSAEGRRGRSKWRANAVEPRGTIAQFRLDPSRFLFVVWSERCTRLHTYRQRGSGVSAVGRPGRALGPKAERPHKRSAHFRGVRSFRPLSKSSGTAMPNALATFTSVRTDGFRRPSSRSAR